MKNIQVSKMQEKELNYPKECAKIMIMGRLLAWEYWINGLRIKSKHN
jgi:hypothetical protein